MGEPDRPTAMPPAYDPTRVEARIYRRWEDDGHFRPRGTGRPFTILMPPPNLTGELHQGHALTAAIQDALIRWHRMRGDDALWLPGVDHAAIAVNALVERELADEGLSRHEIGREAFLARVWSRVERSRGRIAEQHRRLGASADWERERFTMDQQRAVRTTFKRLYDDGLIYRGEYVVNWCVDCGTAVSDLEVDHADVAGFFWHVRYPLLDAKGEDSGEHLVVATTRPETIPADTAVAVHPDDPRHRDMIGRSVRVPTGDACVPVIADAAVDAGSGSGALKVTPAHDPTDFEIGARHGLEVKRILLPDGSLSAAAGPWAGLDRFEARERIAAFLDERGLIERVEPHTHAVGHCQRSGTVIEPLVSEQWFVRTQPLAGPALAAVRDGRIRFVPARFEPVYTQWMENLRDWCISRQIWWGHRIPVWTCADCEARSVEVDDPSACTHCGGTRLEQDPDTLDTWFSSGLWPFSTLGWPERGADLERYYPTQVMETGYDILFFWVARMIMLSLYIMDGVVPFETVYLHGLVRAADGSKMSKSKGNTVDPIEQVERYGADATRYALVASATPGSDQRVSEAQLEGGRNLANKLWNASRFVLEQIAPEDDLALAAPGTGQPLEDRWILSRCARLCAEVSERLEQFELAEAARTLRAFLWEEFADWYIELAKVRLRAGDRTPLAVLACVLDRLLRLLHPFMPFETEELWQRLQSRRVDPDPAPALIAAAWPEPETRRLDPQAERELDAVRDFVRAIRNVRAEKRVDPGRHIEAWVVGGTSTASARALEPAIAALGRVHPLHIVERSEDAPSERVASAVLATGRVVLPMAGLLDVDAERTHLFGQVEKLERESARSQDKLANRAFVARAPSEIVARERERLADFARRLRALRDSLAELD